MLITNSQCHCTVLPFVKEPVEADPFCETCNGTGKIRREYSLIEKLMIEKSREDKSRQERDNEL